MARRRAPVEGQWGVKYDVTSLANCDSHLKALCRMWSEAAATSDSRTFAALRRIRMEQDLILDARLDLMQDA